MKLSLLLVLTLLVACKTDDEQPLVNKACVVAHRMSLPNLECDPMGTNLGWYPDTCICQLATKVGDVRVPTQLIWVKAGVLEPPKVESVYAIPPPVTAPTPHPAPPPQPQLRKE